MARSRLSRGGVILSVYTAPYCEAGSPRFQLFLQLPLKSSETKSLKSPLITKEKICPTALQLHEFY